MIVRASSGAFVMAILVWPALALGWIPGGFPVAAFTSVGCLAVSYVCYRLVRVRSDAKQVVQLRAMQLREDMSDHELLSFVVLHRPNLLDGFFKTFGARLHASIEAKEPHNQNMAVIFPWVSWSETDTANAKQITKTIFNKCPADLNSVEAGLLLETIEAGRGNKGGLFMIADESIAKALKEIGGVSMNSAESDTYDRKRLPDIAKEIGISQEVIEELGWIWPSRR